MNSDVKYHMAMVIPPNSSSMALPATTVRTRSSRRGSIGRAANRASTTTNTTSSSRPAQTGATTGGDVQPCSALPMTP
jgi:hypothetical protein